MGLDNLLNNFKKEEAQRDTGNNPFSNLKHDVVRVNKVGSMTIRLLPPKDLENGSFYQPYKQVFLNNGVGEGNGAVFTSAYEEDPNDPMEKAVAKWTADGSIQRLNKYGNGYSTGYFIQGVPVVKDPQTGNLTNKLDANGQPDVYVIQIKYALFSKLMEALGNEANDPSQNHYFEAACKEFGANPANQGNWRLMSPNLAYSITLNFNKNAKQPVDYYNLNVNANSMLPPLPNGWENSLEDLGSLAVPSYKSAPEFVDKFIAETNASLYGNQSTGTAPFVQGNPNTNVPNGNFNQQPQTPPSAKMPSTPAQPQGQMPQGQGMPNVGNQQGGFPTGNNGNNGNPFRNEPTNQGSQQGNGFPSVDDLVNQQNQAQQGNGNGNGNGTNNFNDEDLPF